MKKNNVTFLPKNSGATGQLPDVTVVHKNGKVDLVEVPSKGQTPASQQTKLQGMRQAIGVAGKNIVVMPDPPANSNAARKIVPVYTSPKANPVGSSLGGLLLTLTIFQVILHEYVNYRAENDIKNCVPKKGCV